MPRRRNGDVDLAPVLLWGSLGIVGLTGFAILRSRANAAKLAAAESAPPLPARPQAPPPPTATPQAPPPNTSASWHRDFSPLYLWILQDGASEWTGVGWYYGHDAEIVDSGSTSPRKVFFTPEGEIRPVLDDLVSQGIAGWFDTIEPTGKPDRNFTGRLDQEDKGVWFWIDNGEEPPHYEASSQHTFHDYV
jgi:hypothetical protein